MHQRRLLHEQRSAQERERQAEMELLNADPFDPEVQARIAERIRQAQVRGCLLEKCCRDTAGVHTVEAAVKLATERVSGGIQVDHCAGGGKLPDSL